MFLDFFPTECLSALCPFNFSGSAQEYVNLDDPTVSYLLEKQPDTPDPLLDFVQSHGSALTVNQSLFVSWIIIWNSIFLSHQTSQQ